MKAFHFGSASDISYRNFFTLLSYLLILYLHVSAFFDVSYVEPLLEKLLKSFQSARDANVLSMANNMFVNPSCTLKAEYLAVVKRLYNSEV